MVQLIELPAMLWSLKNRQDDRAYSFRYGLGLLAASDSVSRRK
jgi:hypothetical protein